MIAKIKSKGSPDNIIFHTIIDGYSNENNEQIIAFVQKALIPVKLEQQYIDDGFFILNRVMKFKGKEYEVAIKWMAFKLDTFDKVINEINKFKTKTLNELLTTYILNRKDHE